mgnify:CR=1 FL=1
MAEELERRADEAELAGLPDVKMYPESMVGYTRGDHEIANRPGLVENLLRQIRG